MHSRPRTVLRTVDHRSSTSASLNSSAARSLPFLGALGSGRPMLPSAGCGVGRQGGSVRPGCACAHSALRARCQHRGGAAHLDRVVQGNKAQFRRAGAVGIRLPGGHKVDALELPAGARREHAHASGWWHMLQRIHRVNWGVGGGAILSQANNSGGKGLPT